MKYTEEDIINSHPRLFRKVKHLETNDGWNDIIFNMCNLIECHINKLDLTDYYAASVAQIKEKFGGLRAYIDNEDEYICGIIAMAEAMCDITCEDCGSFGERRSGGWIRTLCDSCHEKHKKLCEKAREIK
jgi:hypothetical protein